MRTPPFARGVLVLVLATVAPLALVMVGAPGAVHAQEARAQERAFTSLLGIPRLDAGVAELRVTDADLARWSRLPRRVRLDDDLAERRPRPAPTVAPSGALAPPAAAMLDDQSKPVLPPGHASSAEEHAASQARRHTIVSWD
jgi:hypothetical protein